MRPKVVASLVVLGIAALPACSAASKAGSSSPGSTSSQTSSTQSTTSPTAPGSSTSAKTARIKVNPGSGQRDTHFSVTFTAPDRTGTISGTTRRYQVGAATAQKQGCVATANKSVGASRAGARVSTTLTPVGGRWCTGTYKGKIVETTMPRCEPGKVCPAFIGILRVVGTFKFRVA
ncbi:MAG: hypothetical protein ACXVUE_23205 [Solirubrobacteraceae bacterium]